MRQPCHFRLIEAGDNDQQQEARPLRHIWSLVRFHVEFQRIILPYACRDCSYTSR